ncbi:hypothetical protein GCM10023229_01670 [Flavisolibacter ginsenosidimutans]
MKKYKKLHIAFCLRTTKGIFFDELRGTISPQIMKRKIATLTIPVPYKRAGNVISQQPVTFDVYEEDNRYEIAPLLDGNELAIANLPVSLHFEMQNDKPVSLRGKKDGNLHVIQDIASKLQEQGLLA